LSLFGECATGTANQCFHIQMNHDGSSLRMVFFFDDVDSSTILVANQCYHAAFVYDYNLRQRFIYLNGVAERIIISNPSASHLYLGQSGNATIGSILIFNTNFI
jgi:hypothetical protein